MLARIESQAARDLAVGRPIVYVTEADYERLLVLTRAAEGQPGADLLRDELERAVIVADGDFPANFVKLNSVVVYEDGDTHKRRKIQLVLPESADIDANRISVLAPVGAALLGLTETSEFTWTMADGRERTLAIVEVSDEPEAAATGEDRHAN